MNVNLKRFAGDDMLPYQPQTKKSRYELNTTNDLDTKLTIDKITQISIPIIPLSENPYYWDRKTQIQFPDSSCIDDFEEALYRFFQSEKNKDVLNLPSQPSEEQDYDTAMESFIEEEKNEIFDDAIEEGNRELIFECLKFKNRSDAVIENVLDFALANNDIELIEAIVKGEENQKCLKFAETTDQPLIKLEFLKLKGVDPKIIDLLFSTTNLTKQDADECRWRKTLANLWELHGTFKIQGEKIEYEGARVNYFFDIILSALRSFNEEYPGEIEQSLHEQLYTLISEASVETSAEEKIEIFNSYKPVLIRGGDAEHLIEIVLWKTLGESYLLIGNQGEYSEVPVKVYKIDSSKVTIDLIQDIDQATIDQEDLDTEKFYKKLPRRFKATPHDDLTSLFTKNWIDKELEQTGENCTWVSLRASMIGVAGMHYWIKNNCELEKNNNKKIEAIQCGLTAMRKCDNFFGIHALLEYAKYSMEAPSRIDWKLVNNIFNEIKDLFNENIIDEQLFKKVQATLNPIKKTKRRIK